MSLVYRTREDKINAMKSASLDKLCFKWAEEQTQRFCFETCEQFMNAERSALHKVTPVTQTNWDVWIELLTSKLTNQVKAYLYTIFIEMFVNCTIY